MRSSKPWLLLGLIVAAAVPALGARSLAQTSPMGIPAFPVQDVAQPMRVPKCSYDPITGSCRSTDNSLLRNLTTRSFMNAASFAGRVRVFLVAGNAYCRQFPRSACSYPCQDNGEVCSLHGAITYGIYACHDSLAEQDVFCMLAPLSSPSLCDSTAACVSSTDSRGQKRCTARFRSNMTQQQQMQYLSDWGTVRRGVWGCCLGSEARWTQGPYCDRFSSHESACVSTEGCMFQPDGTCTLNRTAWLDGNFPSGPRNLGWPLQRLKNDMDDCAAITNATRCAEATYDADPKTLRWLLRDIPVRLAAENVAVPSQQCDVWNK